MKSIWKFPLKVTDEQTISIPKDYQPLDVQVQNGEPCFWAKVNPESPKVELTLVTRGTGHEIPDGVVEDYIGTYQMAGGALVWHVFQDLE